MTSLLSDSSFSPPSALHDGFCRLTLENTHQQPFGGFQAREEVLCVPLKGRQGEAVIRLAVELQAKAGHADAADAKCTVQPTNHNPRHSVSVSEDYELLHVPLRPAKHFC